MSWVPANPLPVWNSDPVLLDNEKLPSWTWLGTNWFERGHGIKLRLTSVGKLHKNKPYTRIESIINETDIGSVKLQLASPMLENDCILTLLSPKKRLRLREREEEEAQLDHCHCPSPHVDQYICSVNSGFDSKSIILSLTPAVSVLLIGVSLRS